MGVPAFEEDKVLVLVDNEACEAKNYQTGRSTVGESVRRGRRKAKRVRIGEPDPSLTGRAGLAAVGEFVEKVGMVGAFDEASVRSGPCSGCVGR